MTAARVADQTIRSLFKFLQDRDEDRTRIMRRTNAAIEGERNRIARDLHDGPVQGVSAASLSLEAVLLMLKAGEIDEGLEVLSKVRSELSEEADNLRRLMSGLRPPLLEERGLIPALRETVDRFGRDNHVHTEFSGRANGEIPQDLETLAYRVVQEALSNSAKHAHPVSVTVCGRDDRRPAPRRDRRRRRGLRRRQGPRVPAERPGRSRLDARTGRARERDVHGALDARQGHDRGRLVADGRRAGGTGVLERRHSGTGQRPGSAREWRPVPASARLEQRGASGSAAGGDVVGDGDGDGLGSGDGEGLGSGDGDGLGSGDGDGLGSGDGDGLGSGEGDGAPTAPAAAAGSARRACSPRTKARRSP